MKPKLLRLLTALVAIAATAALSGCANRPGPAPGAPPPTSSWGGALSAAIGMPPEDAYRVELLEWADAKRGRPVPSKLYLPASAARPAALVVISHGIGGSREGYSYIGKFLAANGIAALHVQHAGSDRAVWFGNPITILSRLHGAAQDTEAIDRAADVRFALDAVFADPRFAAEFDPARIGMFGHSYGANTALLIAGARVPQGDNVLDFTDVRVRAAVMVSAPPFYGQGDPRRIVGDIAIPTLHITATGDEITIPGYRSGVEDRVAMFEAISLKTEAKKLLAVFKNGSHSMFTDRLGTGGAELNPKVKKATRELVLAFFAEQLQRTPKTASGAAVAAVPPASPLADWARAHVEIISQTRFGVEIGK